MKYIFARGALAIFLLGMVLSCGKSVDAKLSLQIVSGCDSGEYATLISDISLYCVSIVNAADNTAYGNPSCWAKIEQTSFNVDINKVIKDFGSGATVKVVVDGRSNNVVKARGTSAPIKLDPKKDVEVTVPFFRVVTLTSTPPTWDGSEFTTLAKDETGSSCSKLPFPAQGHTATLFPSGHVMVVGSGSRPLPTGVAMAAFLIDPYLMTFVSIPPGSTDSTTMQMLERVGHTASLLSNGKVAIVGGWKEWGPTLCFCFFPITSSCGCLIKDVTVIDGAKMMQPYDYSTQDYSSLSITSVNQMTNGRSGHEATVLQGNQILVNDSLSQSGLLSGATLAESAITVTPDPFTGSGSTATVLSSQVANVSGLYGGTNVGVLVQDSITPSTFTFTASSGSFPARNHPLGLKLTTPGALFFGGLPVNSSDKQVIYISASPSLACPLTNRSDFPTDGYTATLLSNGYIFIAGGESTLTSNTFVPGSTFYLVPISNLSTLLACPLTDVFSIYPGPPMKMPRTGHTASLLPDGRLILVGGTSADTTKFSNDQVASSAEVLAFDLSQ